MNWLTNHWLELLFLGGYLSMLAYHAFKGQREATSISEFLIGGRRLGGVVIALSFYATFVSSVTFVGHAGRSYTRGPAWWITCVVVFTSMVFLSWFVVAPPFVKAARRFNSLTVPELLGARYQSLLVRRMAGIVVVVASIVYMVAVYEGAARSLESLLDLNRTTVMLILFVIVTSYTLTGGFHSVVATDSVQGLMLLAGGISMPVAMIVRKGGIGPLLREVQQTNSEILLLGSTADYALMLGLALGVGLKICVEPRQLSRFYGLSSDEQLNRGRWLAPALLFATYLFMLPVGFMAHAFIPPEAQLKGGQVVPYLLGTVKVLGPIGGAFFLTGLAAAAMSSLDSVLLVAASSIDHDIIAPHREERSAMTVTRVWIFVLSAVAAVTALNWPKGIVELSSLSGSVYAACFLPTLIWGLFWSKGSRIAAVVTIALGLLVTLGWSEFKDVAFSGKLKWLHEVYVGTTLALVSYGVISMFSPENARK